MSHELEQPYDPKSELPGLERSGLEIDTTRALMELHEATNLFMEAPHDNNADENFSRLCQEAVNANENLLPRLKESGEEDLYKMLSEELVTCFQVIISSIAKSVSGQIKKGVEWDKQKIEDMKNDAEQYRQFFIPALMNLEMEDSAALLLGAIAQIDIKSRNDAHGKPWENELFPAKFDREVLINDLNVFASKCQSLGEFLEMLEEGNYDRYINLARVDYLAEGKHIDPASEKEFEVTLASDTRVRVTIEDKWLK